MWHKADRHVDGREVDGELKKTEWPKPFRSWLRVGTQAAFGSESGSSSASAVFCPLAACWATLKA